MEKLDIDIFSGSKDLRDPFSYAVPLVEYYLRHGTMERFEMDNFQTINAIVSSSLLADWRIVARNNPQELRRYLDNVIQIIKQTEERGAKNILSVPIMRVCEKIQDIEETEEIREKIFEEVEDLCNKDIELTRLSRFICSGGEYQDFDERLDM